MSKVADYTLKGFLYQFNVTLQQLLNANDNNAEVTVEGIIEDIDIQSNGVIEATQCKYHETVEAYSISDISKPILQMLVHYSENQSDAIKYKLYAHFPNEPEGNKTLTSEDIKPILQTQNIQYLTSYIAKLAPPNDDSIQALVDKLKKTNEDKKAIKDYYIANPPEISILEDFLIEDRFEFIIGKSFENLEEENIQLLESNTSLKKEDIRELFYPSAMQLIADKSIKHDVNERKIIKSIFLNDLEGMKKVAITRWVKELKSYKQILTFKRKELKANLNKNHRLRYFLFDENAIENFDDEIVNFISDYLDKYHRKIQLHDRTPIFCFDTEDTSFIAKLRSRLFQKDIKAIDGFEGTDFFEKAFTREAEININEDWREFHLKICNKNDEIIQILNETKSHELFVIGTEYLLNDFDIRDVNVNFLNVNNFNELKYVLLLKDTVE